jgi:hypothetical protein
MFDLKGFRTEMRITQGDLAEILNVTQAHISRMQKQMAITDSHRDILVSKFGEDVVLKYESSRTKLYRQNIPASDEVISIPLVHIDSVGGVHSQNAILEPEYVEKYVPFADARANDFCIYQSGDSMYPKIPPGAILHVREVVDWQDYFGYGGLFVIVLDDDRRITKIVDKSAIDATKFVLCKSINPEHADEELPRAKIVRVFKIIHVLINSGW